MEVADGKAIVEANIDVWRLFLAASAVVLVNVATFWIKDYFTDKMAIRRKQRDVFQANATPLLHNIEQITSRMLEIVTASDAKMNDALVSYRGEGKSAEALASRFRLISSEACNFNRLESTAFRLINALTSIQEFTVGTLEITNSDDLLDAHKFLHGKIPMGFRGNIFKKNGDYQPVLSTEVQERIAAQFYCDQSVFPLGLNVKEFLAEVDKGAPGVHLVEPVLNFLAVSPVVVKEILTSDENVFSNPTGEHRHVINLVHATIYMIDFIQDFGDTSHFEEHRILLVKILRLWCEHQRPIYLYKPKDLNRESSYVQTYSDVSARKHKYSNILRLYKYRKYHREDDVLRCGAINYRAEKFAKSHAKKVVSAAGLEVTSAISGRKYEFKIDDSLHNMYLTFTTYVSRERGALH